jgi:hypothetical protein
MYITPDRQLAGRYNPATRQWDPLDEELRDSVQQGLEMLDAGPASASLFTIPIAPPEE